MGEEIIVDISAAGNVNLETRGFKGASCAKATEQIEIVLGGGQKKTKKPEYFAPATTGQRTKLTF